MNKSSIPRVVIIGAGFGGLKVARSLKNAPVDVIVIDKKNHHLFQPLLYQAAIGALSATHIAVPIRHILRKQKNARVFMDEVSGIDLSARTVRTRNQEINYDFLVVATGAVQHYFDHPEWKNYAPSLKTIDDALQVREKILISFERAEMESNARLVQRYTSFVLVGAGPTGVEMAGAIADFTKQILTKNFRCINPNNIRIILVEAGPRILTGFSEESAAMAHRHLLHLGVEIKTNASVKKIDAQGVHLENELLSAETVIWTAGVKASPAARWLGAAADRQGRVVVEPNLSLPNHPNVFVIGDAARVIPTEKNSNANPPSVTPLPGLAPVAIAEGKFVACVIRDKLKGLQAHQLFKYTSKGNLAVVGKAAAIAEIGKLKFDGIIAWIIWAVIHIAYLIGFRSRILVLFEWFFLYVSNQWNARFVAMEAERFPEPSADHQESKTG